MGLRIHCFQQVCFEGPGFISTWAEKNYHQLNYTRFYENDRLPDAESFDLLLIMGGPMGVYDESVYPWLKREKQAIRDFIAKGKKLLGICLGAQLLADALGAKVYQNEVKEIGWFDVRFSEASTKLNFFNNLTGSTVFQWHGDTFNLPKDATLLASSDVCKNQAFIYKNQILALQFHLEVTPESLAEMIKHGAHELINGIRIQSEEEILSQNQNYEGCNQLIISLLNEFSKDI